MHTKAELMRDLEAMGLDPRGALMVHSSMKSIGAVEGGADTVLDAFMEYYRDGLFMMPTHTWGTVRDNTVYDPGTSPSCVGILPELFRQRDGVVRSLHPSHSVAAWGPSAADYVKGEETRITPCDPAGCWGRLYDLDAKILLVGVGHNRNTYIHSVEEMLDIPERLTPTLHPVGIRMPDGSVRDVRIHRHWNPKDPDVSQFFVKFEAAFRYHGVQKIVKFGDADCILCDARGVYEVCKRILTVEPDCFLDCEVIDERLWK